MSEELLPCPFCGSSAEMECVVIEHWVHCIGCSIETPMYYSPEHAAAKWNARVPVVAASVQVDNAGVCRFLACLCESVTRDGYVLSYAAVADGSYADRAHAIGGVWTTKELRAAILAALPA